jgi:DNA-binding LacI/PurR family transcriptional regulator
MAIGAMKVLKEFKLDVPGKIKVIGFDGTELAASHIPALSTISQPSLELGTQVAKNLVSVTKQKKIADISLTMNLIARTSTQTK